MHSWFLYLFVWQVAGSFWHPDAGLATSQEARWGWRRRRAPGRGPNFNSFKTLELFFGACGHWEEIVTCSWRVCMHNRSTLHWLSLCRNSKVLNSWDMNLLKACRKWQGTTPPEPRNDQQHKPRTVHLGVGQNRVLKTQTHGVANQYNLPVNLCSDGYDILAHNHPQSHMCHHQLGRLDPG